MEIDREMAKFDDIEGWSEEKLTSMNSVAQIGMATGRVWAGFLHTRTRPAGQDPQPGPDPFTNRVFFRARTRPRRAPSSGPPSRPNLKALNLDLIKKKKNSRLHIRDHKITNHSQAIFINAW